LLYGCDFTLLRCVSFDCGVVAVVALLICCDFTLGPVALPDLGTLPRCYVVMIYVVVTLRYFVVVPLRCVVVDFTLCPFTFVVVVVVGLPRLLLLFPLLLYVVVDLLGVRCYFTLLRYVVTLPRC